MSVGIPRKVAQRLKRSRVMIAGVGNIGSFLGLLLAPLVDFIRLVDRDVVEAHNITNQVYGPDREGLNKVTALDQLIRQRSPNVQIERRAADLADLPLGDFADVDIHLAGLDSLGARQIVAEHAYTLGKTYIDGGVGDPLLAQVQVFFSARACLECGWSPASYRQRATEVPCAGDQAKTPRTLAPACVGACVAGLMVAQLIKLFTDDPPTESYQISGDLMTGRFVASQLRKNQACRFNHESGPSEFELGIEFDRATLADVAEFLESRFGDAIQIKFRRGIFGEPLFESSGFVGLAKLKQLGASRLADVGLTSRDRLILHHDGRRSTSHLKLEAGD